MKKYKNQFLAVIILVTMLISVCFVPINATKLIPMLEAQVTKALGVDVHIEKLVLRLGTGLKLKTPLMHVMYQDGRKFAQFDGIKFYISYLSLFKGTPVIKNISAKKAIIKLSSDDEHWSNLCSIINSKNFNELPDAEIKNYNITYRNKNTGENYYLEGQNLELRKISKFKNFKLQTQGVFSVNNKKFISYDLAISPQLEIPDFEKKFDVEEIISQIVELDFHSDIIADLKIFKTSDDIIQASGFVNIDNISVLDPAQKSAKSFIYLTFLGDKASILSNIYTSQDKKVYIEGMLNNSKKPNLDLKVKTDEIQIGDLFKKVKVLADLSRFKKIKSVNGQLNANFMIKGDLNKLKSNGYLKIANANVVADGLNIENINSEIDFNNNSVNIVNAIGYANKAPITLRGKIDKKIDIELLMNKVGLQYLCPEKYGVKKGIISLIVNFSGTLQNFIHKEKVQIDDLLVSKNGFEISLDTLKYDTNKSNTAYLTNINCNNTYTETIKIPSMKLIFNDENIKIPNTDIFMDNSKLTAFADVSSINKELNFNTVIKGFVNSKDIKQFNTISAQYPVNLNINGGRNSQNINAQVLFEKPLFFDDPTLLNLVAKLDKKTLKFEDLSMLSFSGNFADDFKQNIKGVKKIIITGFIENFTEPLLKNIRLFVPQQLNIHVSDTIAQVKGDLFINGVWNKPEIVGQISVANLFNQQMQMTLNNATFDFNKNNMLINAPMLKLGDTSLSVTGNMVTEFAEKLTFKALHIKSKYLNTDTILMYKDLPITKGLPIEVIDGKFYSERILANIYSSPLYLTAFSSNFVLKNDLLSLSNIASEMFNGKLAGSLDFNLKDERFNSNLMARNVSAAPIFDVISNRKETISGTMDFDMTLSGDLASKNSLNGDIKFIVNNGKMSTLGKLEHLLYAQNVIADSMLRTSLSVVTKAITLKDTGLFKYLRGNVTLENGVANINMLQSQGPLMALFIKGQYHPQTDYAKLTVLGRLSDEIVSGLGAFGDFSLNKLMVMITGEENKFNILPEDFDKIPQLPMKNTKEFRSLINGNIDKTSSVILFNWISYSQKSLIQKEVPMEKVKLPSFVDELPY